MAADHRLSPLQVLKTPSGMPTPQAVSHLTAKLDCIQAAGVLALDLTWLNNNLQKALARHAAQASVQRLRLLEAPRATGRHPAPQGTDRTGGWGRAAGAAGAAWRGFVEEIKSPISYGELVAGRPQATSSTHGVSGRIIRILPWAPACCTRSYGRHLLPYNVSPTPGETVMRTSPP